MGRRDERAAIMEYHGGLPREEAERLADEREEELDRLERMAQAKVEQLVIDDGTIEALDSFQSPRLAPEDLSFSGFSGAGAPLGE